MPYTSPTTQTAGAIATAAYANSLKAAADFLANPPTCRVFHNTTQSVPDAGFLNPVLFNSEAHDTDNMHSTSVNTGRITINTAGVYVLTFTTKMTGFNDYLYVQGTILLNGATFVGGETTNHGGSYEPWLNITTPPIKCIVGDYFVVSMFQDNTGAAARLLLANTAIFGATWVGLG